MFYAIVDQNKIESCADMKCQCFCSANIMRYTKDKSKAILSIYKECKCCNATNEYTLHDKKTIDNILQKNDEWKSKNIV